MALGGPRARPASRSLSREDAAVGGKVSCWRRLRHLAGGSRRHPPHRACVLLCVLAVWLCGQVSRLRQAQIGCRRRAEWLGGVRLG
eukprot:COSAG05_NODE_4459_length_1504_cov_3465.990043_1_plen_86_part_00